MFIEIVRHTPVWAIGVLGLLIVLGVSQMRSRSVSLQRATILPAAMLLLSLAGVAGSFPRHTALLLAWLLGICAAIALLRDRIDTRGVRFEAEARRFQLPGSGWPMVLMLSIFTLKFSVAVALALKPLMLHVELFTCCISAAYGFLSGAFLARTLALWKLTRRVPAGAPSL